MNQSTYLSLLAQARRHSRRADEAEDLLQNVLLAALQAGRGNLNAPQNRRWVLGALSKRAAFEARSAIRRRAREHRYHAIPRQSSPCEQPSNRFIAALPASLRTTALLALTGHTRTEIAYLLNLSAPALRQRIAQLRKRWQMSDATELTDFCGLRGTLPFGPIRRALITGLRHIPAPAASHDPDGHLFLLGDAHKTLSRGNLKVLNSQRSL